MRWVVIVLVAVAALASRAEAKPTIAILTLESDGGDRDALALAEDLTDALRTRAKIGTGAFTLAAGSEQNLVDLKVLTGCIDEAPACMAAVGAELAADRLVWGRLERRGAAYQVHLRMLNVDTKAIERTLTEVLPADEASGAALQAWGKRLYNRLTGAATEGALIVKADVDRATVALDGQVRGALTGGVARIEGLSAGRYRLTIEAEGHQRFEADVEITAGADTVREVQLAHDGASPPAVAAPAGGCAHCGAGGDPRAALPLAALAGFALRRSRRGRPMERRRVPR